MTIVQHDDYNDPGQNVAEKAVNGWRCMTIGRVPNSKGGVGGGIDFSVAEDECSSTPGHWSRLWARGLPHSRQKHNRQNHELLLPNNVPQRLLKLLTLICANSTGVFATPIHERQDPDTGRTHRFFAREVTEKTWIPIIVIFVAAGVLIILSHPSRRSTFTSLVARIRAPHNNPATTELTAEQLAGSINNAGTANNNSNGNNTANTTTTRPRRSRRPRRTPSQMSTHSLPAYAKEPGEQELVVLQGIQDMEDVPVHQPQATVVNLDEDAEESADGYHGQSQYPPVPESPTHTPLLQDDPTGAQSLQDPIAGFRAQGRSSHDSGNDSADTTSLIRIESHDPEFPPNPQGEAPAYFEVVEQSGRGNITTPSLGFIDAGPHNAPVSMTPATTAEAIPPPATAPEATPQRRSGFRSLLSRMSVAGAPTHIRNDSITSATTSSSLSHSHIRGTSASILSPFRTLSRQRSITSHNSSRVNLTSPSLISLNSISAPLTHTAVRAEFTYPKSGPTPEQIKFISSRESLARFGLPYGPDAVAFAASVSRVDLAGVPGERPPEFEDAVASNSGGGDVDAGGSMSMNVGSSGLGGESGEMQEVSLVDEQSQALGVPEAGPSVVGLGSASVDGLPVEREAVDVLALAGVSTVAIPGDSVETEESGAREEQGKRGNSGEKEAQLVSVQPIQAPSTVETEAKDVGNVIISSTSEAPASQKAATTPPTAEEAHPPALSLTQALPTTDLSPPSKPPIEPTDQLPTQPPAITTQSSIPTQEEMTTKIPVPPPSSYHLPAQPYGASLQRSESRASQMSYASYTSYASDITYQTAVESLSSRRGVTRRANLGDDDIDDGHSEGEGEYSETDGEGERPLTPTLGGESLRSRRHGRESTDATVVPTRQERHFSVMTITHA